MCKNNLDKAKIKFENYVEARSIYGHIFQNRFLEEDAFKDSLTHRFLEEDAFKDSLTHRCLAVVPQLTEDCYRILILKIPKNNMSGEDFYECMRYILLNADFGLANTSEAGHICIIDCTFLPEKLKQRIQIHNSPEDLLECFPPEYIPKEFGGKSQHCDQNSDNWRRFFIENRIWIRKHDEMKMRD
ncbi:CRAL/TRIO domain [Popillia japonica]|uniref:CRAL/TRIO domain n=1 Tax=Popillia japonica TaxID=7064 RepID=A0AAW1MGT9_POPJA